MGPNEQNQYFAELRQKVCLYMYIHVHVEVLQRSLPCLDGKLEHFVPKKWKMWFLDSSQTDFRDLGKPKGTTR